MIVNTKRKRTKKIRRDESTKIVVPAAGGVIVRRGRLPPQISNKGQSTFVRNTELGVLVGTAALGAFLNARFNLVPGNLNWLSGIAGSYNKWRWHFLKVMYIPIVPTTTPGQVTLAFGYDVADAVPTSIIQTQQMYNSVSSPVWAGYEGTSDMNTYLPVRGPGAVSLLLDVTRLGGPTGDAYYRFANNTSLAAYEPEERNIYVPAYVDISTSGGLAASVGDLFIEYIVEFIEPTVDVLNV